MKNKKKWVVSILVIIIIAIYIIYTFPHNFIMKDKRIKDINISYTENIMNQNSSSLQSFFLEKNEEVNNLINILNKYKYRKYISNHDVGFDKPTSEIRIRIDYNEGISDMVLLYSDGTLIINTKSSHIGFTGTKQTKAMYKDIYDQYKNILK